MFTEFYQDIKGWFKYSWSIFLARIETISGFLIGAISLIDLTPLLGAVDTGFTWAQGATIGGILFVKGIISEIGRRQGTVELSDGQMLPAKIDRKDEAIAVVEGKIPAGVALERTDQ
jgi:hypothetical protein